MATIRFPASSTGAYRFFRIMIGLLFVYSGAVKALDLNAFSRTVQAFAILPPELSFPAAVVVVSVELLFGLGLTVDVKGSLCGILILLSGFMAVIGYALFMGYDIDCGCFGPEDPEAAAFKGLYSSLYRDILLPCVVISLFVWRYINHHVPLKINGASYDSVKRVFN